MCQIRSGRTPRRNTTPARSSPAKPTAGNTTTQKPASVTIEAMREESGASYRRAPRSMAYMAALKSDEGRQLYAATI
jgi:hypothetical protein